MPSKVLNILFSLIIGIVLAGCASVKARTYVETKERVDQEPAGNAGYLFGAASPQPAAKKTRQIYVLEVTQKIPEDGKLTQDLETNTNKNSSVPPDVSPAPSVSSQVKEVLQEIATPEPFVAPQLPAQYTVSKDDTLQTIAKKFYNSYGKWPKIYEANKDKIPDPNRIKPGLVLTIPAL